MTGRLATWLAAAGCALALAGCGGDGAEATPSEPAIPAPVAEDLAGQSDELADLLAEVRTCDAAHAADALNDSVERAAGQIPDALEAELRAVVAELVDTVNCEQPAEDEEGEENGNGKGKGKGKDKDKDDDEAVVTDTTITVGTTTE